MRAFLALLVLVGLTHCAAATPGDKATLYLQRAEQHEELGQHRSAFYHYGKAYDYAKLSRNAVISGLAAERFGLAHLRVLRFPLARRYLGQALRLARQRGDRLGEGRSLMNLGLLEYRLGRLDLAQQYLEQAKPLLNEDLLARWRVNSALVRHHDSHAQLLQELFRLGQQEQALPAEYALNLASLMVENGDTDTAARILSQLPKELQAQPEYLLARAQLRLRLGDPAGALLLLRQTKRKQARSQAYGVAFALNRAMAHRQLKQFKLAHRVLQEASQTHDSPRLRLQLAALAMEEKKPAQAQEQLDAAKALLEVKSDPVVLAWWYLTQGELSADPQLLLKAGTLGESIGLEELIWRSVHARARLARRSGQPQRAAELFTQSLSRAAAYRAEFSDEESLIAYQADKYPYFVEVADFLLELGQPEAAFSLTERARSVRLREHLRLAPDTAGDLHRIQSRLPAGACLLSYVALQDSYLVFLVTPRKLVARRLPVSQEKVVRWLRGNDGIGGLFATPGLKNPFPKQLAALAYQELVGPLEAELVRFPTWYLELDGALASLPFSSLITGSAQPLLEEHTLIRLAHATPAQEHEPGSNQALVMGAPLSAPQTPAPHLGGALRSFRDRFRPLPGAAVETSRVGELHRGATVNKGQDCRESSFKRLAETASIIHLATHGFVDNEYPLKSGLLMFTEPEEDGLLTAAEIKKLNLSHSKAVLSACETAAGREYRGEGVVGLTYSFLAAGADEVVASLWPVDDDHTMALMTVLHRKLAAGEDAAEALQAARRQALKEGRTLYEAGAFVVYGRL